jgi:4-hydroxy-3-methylbut-2-enyl diphosphate reductase
MHDWEGIAERARDVFPDLWTAARNDLCFATTNRQAALQAIAAEADAIVVIGSANSSNTLALAKVASAAGCPTVLRVDGPGELDADALGDARVVGVTAGASAPEDLVQAVIARLAPSDGVVPVHVTEEDEYFPPPRELRELMTTLDVAVPVLLGGGRPTTTTNGAFTDDRRVDASGVLAAYS